MRALMMMLIMVAGSATVASGRPAAKSDGLSDVATIVAIDNECEQYQVGPVEYGCSGLMYLHWRQGRTGYMLPTKNGGTVMLSGSSDSQLTPENYTLNIDRMVVGFGKGAPVQPYPATGKCSSVISTDGQFVRSITCKASIGTEDVVLRFKGANTPVTVKNF